MYIVKKIFLKTQNKIFEIYKINIPKKFWDSTNNLFNPETKEEIPFIPPIFNEKITIYENNNFLNNELKYYYENLLQQTRENIKEIYITYNEQEI